MYRDSILVVFYAEKCVLFKSSHLTHEYISYLGYKSPRNSANKRLNNFQLLGKRISLKNPSLDQTLIQYLRNDLGLCGTKLACGEGSCGACTVTMARPGISFLMMLGILVLLKINVVTRISRVIKPHGNCSTYVLELLIN
jgi:hypothetical protein